ARWRAERLLVQWSAHGVAYKDLTRDIGSAVLLYRSKFSDCPVGMVANSYPNVDLLWDNVIAGPWGVAPLYSASASPGPSFPGTPGSLQNARADDSRQRTL